MRIVILGLLVITAGTLQAQDKGWQNQDQGQYLCGGVGDESMAIIQAERRNADLSLLFVAGQRGAYVADVDVTISGKGLAQPLQFKADGPTCLLKLPKGSYTVEASHGDQQRKQKISSPSKKQLVLHWPDGPEA
ncbi:hypothetical protein [Chitinimonas naiadis]